MTRNKLDTLRPPNKALLLYEARAALDFARMLPSLARSSLQQAVPAGDTLTIVVPGFGSGDAYTLPLRHYLKRQGFRVEGWGLGTNLAGTNLPHTLADLSDRWDLPPRDDYRGEAGVPYLADRLFDRVCERHAATGMAVSLVGWSLGGFLAREVARDLPQIVDRVITMGSPIVGGPKYTAAAQYFLAQGQDLDWIEAEINRRAARPIGQPITVIASRTDGIVGWEATVDRQSPRVRHIEVDAAHLGMGFNREIWAAVVTALSDTVELPAAA